MEDMNQIRKNIQTNIHFLSDQSRNLQVLLFQLLNFKIISQIECNQILHDNVKTNYEKFSKLYNLILQKLDRDRRNEKTCQLFLISLRQSGNEHIVRKLQSILEQSIRKKERLYSQSQLQSQQKIETNNVSFNILPPLKFISLQSENIEISKNGSAAKRKMDKLCFCDAIAFTDRSVGLNEKIRIKLTEISTDWSGFLRFGFTNSDPCPKALRKSWPMYAMPCHDLPNEAADFRIKSFSEFKYPVKKDSILDFVVNSKGNVEFSVDGEEKGIFIRGINISLPLWAVFDIYGNSIAIELMKTENLI